MTAIRNHIGFILTILIVATVIALGFMPRPVLVDTVIVARGQLQVTIEEEGKTRVIDRYVLSAPVDGFARRLDLDIGDFVEKDQQIIYLEPLRSTVLDPRSRAEAEARLSAAKATLKAVKRNVNAAKADADFAARDLERIKKLYDVRTISLDRFQQAEANARRTKANLESVYFDVEVAKFEKNAAEAVLNVSADDNETPETVSIHAPVSGSVLKIHHESEGVVNKGDPLLEIGDRLSLEVEVDVLSRDAIKIVKGTKVRFERWGGEHTLEGVVRTIEPVGFTKVSALGVEEQRVLVIVDITSPQEKWLRLGDGYRMETVFILWQGEDVLQVPSSALFRYKGDWAVFVVNNEGYAQLKTVAIGQRSGIVTEVLTGLDEGEIIINHPSSNVIENSRIRTK